MAVVTWQSCLSNVLLFMLIAGMAGSCDARLFLTKFKAPKGMLAALFSQFVLLPAVGFASVTLFPQDAVTVVTLLVVTTSPGGGFSGRPPRHTQRPATRLEARAESLTRGLQVGGARSATRTWRSRSR